MSLLDAVSASWWSWLFNSSWQSALVGLALLGVAWGLRKVPAPLRYGVLVVALVKFAVPPMIGVPVSVPRWMAAGAGAVAQELDPTMAAADGGDGERQARRSWQRTSERDLRDTRDLRGKKKKRLLTNRGE